MSKLLALPFKLAGHLVMLVIGFILMIAGVIISLTVVGAIVGVPMIVIGLILAIRSVFP